MICGKAPRSIAAGQIRPQKDMIMVWASILQIARHIAIGCVQLRCAWSEHTNPAVSWIPTSIFTITKPE